MNWKSIDVAGGGYRLAPIDDALEPQEVVPATAAALELKHVFDEVPEVARLFARIVEMLTVATGRRIEC